MTLPTGRLKSVETRRPRAFTLIELILVMAMLLVVLSVSGPSLSRFFHGRTLDSEARRFLSLTRYGQSRAVSEGVPMVLWIDAKQGTYGLQQEAGYTDLDTKAVDYEVGKDLRLEVADVVVQSSGQFGQAQSAGRNVPGIRFLPDGFVGESSLQTVWIHEGSLDSVAITQSRNRLNYEISTNLLQNARR